MFEKMIKFGATMAQEVPGVFDNVPVESIAHSTSGFFGNCTDWVCDNRPAVIGATVAVAVGVGAYYSYPWVRRKLKRSSASNPGSGEKQPETNAGAQTAEELVEGLETLTRKAENFMKNNPRPATE